MYKTMQIQNENINLKTQGTLSVSSSLTYSNLFGFGATSGTVNSLEQWGFPERVDVVEYNDRIEMIYKQTSIITFCNSWGYQNPPQERIYKVVYSCVDGKWNKSEPIYGKIIPPQEESYEFED